MARLDIDVNYKGIHREQSKRNPKLVCYDHGKCLVRLSTMTLQDLEENTEKAWLDNQFATFMERDCVDILSSKGEIVCLATECGEFYVCKPSTGDFIHLPKASPSFAFESCAAFGYVLTRNQYKLAHIFTAMLGVIRCEIFTITHGEKVGSCSWRVIEDECPHQVYGHNGVMVGNNFYWPVDNDDDDVELVPKYILFLDIDTETFGTIVAPLEIEGCEYVIAEIKDSLCAVDNHLENSTMAIWMLKLNSSNEHVWEKEYNIILPPHHKHDFVGDIIPIYDRNGEIIIQEWLKRIYYYNIETGNIRIVENGMFSKFMFGLYFDCFFSLVH